MNANSNRLSLMRLETSFVCMIRFKGFTTAGKDTVNNKIVSERAVKDLSDFPTLIE